MKKNYFSKSRLLLTLFALLIGASPTWAQKELPYSYGFEDNNLATDGWTTQNPSGLNTSEFGINTGAKKTGEYGFRFSSYHDNGANTQYLISPELNAPNGVNLSFSYTASATSTESFKVGYSSSDSNVESFTWDAETTVSGADSWKTYEASYPANTKYIAIYYYSKYKYRLFVDDFIFALPPTCIKPTNLATSNITSNSVTLSWTSDADAFNVQYKKAADTEWTDVSGTVTSPYTLENLSSATSYQVRVRTYCDATDQSDWTDAVSFTTDCATLTIDANNSFSEDFSGSGIPTCWGTIDSGSYKWSISSNRASTGYYGPIYLILPPMELSVNSLLTFDNYFNYANDYNGNTNKSSIVLSTTGTAAENFSTTLYTFTKDELPSSSSTSLPKEISLAAYTGQTVYIAFKHEASNGHSWAVGNVVVKEAPACIKPADLAASNPTAEGATLSWTAGGDEADWQISYSKTEAFDPTTDGTIVDVTTNPYTLTGLDKETTYYVAIRSKKGDDTSDWTDKISFTTTATCITPTGLAANNVGLNSATLTWTDETTQSKWEISYSTTSGNPDNGTIVEVTEKTCTIENLTPGTTYYASVRAVNSDTDKSAWSTEISFTPGVLTVNEGTTTNQYIPIFGNYTDELNNNTQFIIPSTSLTSIAGKQIDKLVFYSSTATTSWGNAQFEVYLKKTDQTTFSSTTLSWDNMEKAYTGALSVSDGKMTITFDDPFAYEDGNLLVGIKQTLAGTTSSLKWYGVSATGTTAVATKANTKSQSFLPKTSIYYSPIATAPIMSVDKSEIAFGLVDQNSEQTATFKIENKGKADLENVTISCTEGKFSIDKTSVEKILSKDDDNYEAAVITVTFNTETIGDFTGTITVSAASVESQTITVSGTVLDPTKMFEDFAGNALPNFWTTKSIGSSAGSWNFDNGYAQYKTSNYASYLNNYKSTLVSPAEMTFTENEKVKFMVKKDPSYNTYESYLLVQYSADGETWTDVTEGAFNTANLPDEFSMKEVTIPATAKQIRFVACGVSIDNIYGGTLPTGARFAINTDGTTQDFGVVEQNAEAEKTYTVTNNGNTDLYLSIDAPEGFSIEGGNALLFTNNKNWNSVYVHAWGNSGDLTTWPGTPATYVGKNGSGEDQYAFVVPEEVSGIVIDNGNNGLQTTDINDFNVTGYYLKDESYEYNNTTYYYYNSWGSAPSALKVAAGESKTFTVTMNTETIGAKSGNIILNTNAINEQSFTIPVTGFIYDSSLPCVTFDDDKLPANWGNASWTFANGIATGKSSNAYLTTPKLIFSEGDVVILKARRQDSDTSDYLTVQGSNDNGSTWTAYSKKLQNTNGLTYPDFGTIVLSDIPTTVNKIRFVGFYAEIDKIWGLNYAPVLSVTTGDPATAVSSPTNYDFGECAADATVTYNFANIGAGTIDITGIAITGDGAAAYSTNWTESVAAPFALTITRAYDGERTEAQEAVVTVTTSDGNFVINVTGIDKAANAPELAVSTNAIDFGKVTEDAVETVTVSNNGTGVMTVDIASDSEDFEVSTAQLTEIGAGESKTFYITFKFSTPYGVKNGKVTVTPTYDTYAAQEITVTGKAKDPDVWSEDFSGNKLPIGWEAGTNWTIADGVAKGSYNYSSTTYLTTPILTVSDATDELNFDYKATANYVTVKIQMSKNGGDFTNYQTISNLNNGDEGTYTITNLEAGNYQFRFANDDYNLDNFEGFKLNLPDHMASITGYTIPASSSYTVTMKEGQSFEATVTVKEMRGVAEELTAKLYMGETVIGTQTGSVAANGTETLTITATPNVAAPEGVQMHIEVEWAGTTMTTEAVTRYVAAITNLTLDETSSDAITAGTYDNVTLKRTFIAGWNTVCLPFTISDAIEIFGEGTKVYEFNSYTDDGTLGFKTTTTLTASYPYIVYTPTEITGDLLWNNITIASNDVDAWYTRKTDSSNDAAYFRGTYAPIDAPNMEGKWGVTSEARIAKGTATASIKGFRAYFELPEGANGARLSFYDDATGITTVIGADELNDDKVYNLGGQRVQNPKKGLYIINGKKVVIK